MHCLFPVILSSARSTETCVTIVRGVSITVLQMLSRRHRMTTKSCDIAVIGSGIGGLCAAARLSYAGYKTIVLERMPILGGRYTWVDYKGYKIKFGAHYLIYGDKDPVFVTLKDVRGRTDFEMRPKPPPKWRIGGKDYEMPAEGVTQETLPRLISLTSRDKQEEERVLLALSRCFAGDEPSDDSTFSEWLHRLTDNRTIYDTLNTLCTQTIGPGLHEISAGEMIRHFLTLRSALAGTPKLIPENGTKPFVDSLAEVVTNHGGENLTRVKVRRIVIRDGLAKGVEASESGGELQIEARAVVSDIGPKKTVELSGEQNFDSSHLEEVRELKPLAGFEFWITSDGPLYDWPGGLYTIETRRAGLWVDTSMIWPDFAPEGKNLMVFYLKPEHPTNYDPKNEYEVFMADLHETFPHFEEQGGEILLARHYRAEWPCMRAVPGPSSERLQKTSIKNLYNVGDGVNPPGWIGGAGAGEGARIVAEELMKEIKA